ncbi:MAG: (d)CMP kinase [Pseudomonadota bacterium]
MSATDAEIPVPVVTVDGPSGSGKGTLSMALAERLNWHRLDSGALYRLVALHALEEGIALDAAAALAAAVLEVDIAFQGEQVVLNGVPVSDQLRTETVGNAASQVAAHVAVREALVTRQRAFVRPPGLIADGRDMGTVIFPAAPLKVFLTASAEVRAERRYNQLRNKGLGGSLRGLLETIKERDERDRTRAVAPLVPADDALVIDSTELSSTEVIALVVAEIEALGLDS